jgi:PAS domain S-box-containing protein
VQATHPVVVVVADHPLTRTFLERLLAEDGYRVVVGVNAAEGLAHVERGGVALVLVDLAAAVDDGLELCRRVRARSDDAYLPVVMLAAADDAPQRQAGLDAGADDYVLKPFDGQELRDRVRIWLQAGQNLRSFQERLQRERERRRLDALRARETVERAHALAERQDLHDKLLVATVQARRLAEQQARTHQALHAVATAAAGAAEPDALSKLLAEQACSLLRGEAASVMWWDESSGVLRPHGAAGLWQGDQDFRLRPGQGIAGLAFQRGEAVVVEDYQRWESAVPLSRASGMRAGVAVPLLVGDRPRGVLAVAAYILRRFDIDQVQTLTFLAALVGPALEAARQRAEVERSRRQLETLRGLAAERAAVVEQLPSGVLVLDAAGKVKVANAAARRDGASAGRAFPAPAGANELHDAVTGRRLAPAETPAARALAGQPVYGFVCGWRRPGQPDQRRLRLSAVPLRDRTGQLVGAVLQYDDLVPDANLHRELAAAEARLRGLYQALDCGVIVCNEVGEIVDANESTERILGLSLAEMRGKRAPSLWRSFDEHGVERPSAERATTRALRTRQPIRRVTTGVLLPGGEHRWIYGDAVPMLGPDGTPEGVVTTLLDITARVGRAAASPEEGAPAIERAQADAVRDERNRLARELHDGVVPALYAVALALTSQARTLPSDAVALRATLRRNVDQIDDVIRELRRRVQELHPPAPARAEFWTELEVWAAELRANAGLDVSVELDLSALAAIDGAATDQLRQIAREALANVTRHAGAHSVWVRAGQAQDRLVLTIEDDGAGPEPRAAQPTGGQGLGNMAQRARALGGQLLVQRRAGGGTVVRVEWPAAAER